MDMSWIDDHRALYLKDPEKGHDWNPASIGGPDRVVPTLLLTTRGRKSGQPRIMPLIYGKTDDGYVVVASKGGAPQHPDWYLNLEADPNVEVQVKHDKFHATAETVSGARRAELWKQMNQVWPPYESYQEKTQREIPIVLLRKR
jgi:proline iminopeptidase